MAKQHQPAPKAGMIAALGSALCGGLLLGMFAFLQASTTFYDEALIQMEAASDASASLAADIDSMRRMLEREEVRRGVAESIGGRP